VHKDKIKDFLSQK